MCVYIYINTLYNITVLILLLLLLLLLLSMLINMNVNIIYGVIAVITARESGKVNVSFASVCVVRLITFGPIDLIFSM